MAELMAQWQHSRTDWLKSYRIWDRTARNPGVIRTVYRANTGLDSVITTKIPICKVYEGQKS